MRAKLTRSEAALDQCKLVAQPSLNIRGHQVQRHRAS